MTPAEIEALFTRTDGTFLFARWGRPIVPVVFGVSDATLEVIKGAIEAVAVLARHPMATSDPELGANLLIFFCDTWAELADVPDLDRLVPDLDVLLARLHAAQANQYRMFRCDGEGAIKAAFVFVRMDQHLAQADAATIALGQAVQVALLWSDAAFIGTSPLAKVPDGGTILRPEIAQVIRAAYDPILPVAATDPSHALRLFARTGRTH